MLSPACFISSSFDLTTLAALQVLGGQYRFPEGFQFGGQQLCLSHVLLSQYLEDRGVLGSHVERVAVVDVHTGIGPVAGEDIIIVSDDETKDMIIR